MNFTHVKTWKLIALSAIVAGFLAGCSRPAPEERLIAVGEDVSDMQEQLSSLNAEINSHQDAIEQLRQERQRARSKLMTLEERLERRATDLAVFRAAQSALLDEPALQDAAVLANVEDGTVTLEGSVSNSAQKQKAADVVRSIPGVESTVVRLQVVEDAPNHDKSDASSG